MAESYILTVLDLGIYLEGGEHRDFQPLRLISPPYRISKCAGTNTCMLGASSASGEPFGSELKGSPELYKHLHP